jgi:Protein of unknown function (DUF3800)
MLVFVDESYRKAADPNARSTFSAVCIREENYRNLERKLFELNRHFWKIENSYDFELKGRLILSERALELPKTREFVSQLVTLCGEVELVPFAVVQYGTFTLASESDRLPNLYRGLLKRVSFFMEERYPGGHAVFFFDGIDHKTNRKVAISFKNFMQKHAWGRACTNILTTPFFCDSVVSPGIQIADVIAYCTNERYVGRRGYLEDYFKQFRSLTFTRQDPDEGFNLWGFQLIPPEEAEASAPPEDVDKIIETGDQG